MRLFIYILSLFISFQVVAQGINEKSLKSSSNEILIELGSIEHVELRSSTENELITVGFENTDETNMPMLFEKQGTIHIKVSNESKILKGIEKNKYRAGQPLFPKYKIVIPNNSNVQLFYDKGNTTVMSFQGNLSMHLNSGTVDIQRFKGTVNITSFSGIINCMVNAASLNVITNKGVLKSLLKDEQLIEDKSSVKGVYKNANNVLNIRTIHAKVTLKPMLTQK